MHQRHIAEFHSTNDIKRYQLLRQGSTPASSIVSCLGTSASGKVIAEDSRGPFSLPRYLRCSSFTCLSSSRLPFFSVLTFHGAHRVS